MPKKTQGLAALKWHRGSHKPRETNASLALYPDSRSQPWLTAGCSFWVIHGLGLVHRTHFTWSNLTNYALPCWLPQGDAHTQSCLFRVRSRLVHVCVLVARSFVRMFLRTQNPEDATSLHEKSTPKPEGLKPKPAKNKQRKHMINQIAEMKAGARME